jgi:hypothetical protein
MTAGEGPQWPQAKSEGMYVELSSRWIVTRLHAAVGVGGAAPVRVAAAAMA